LDAFLDSYRQRGYSGACSFGVWVMPPQPLSSLYLKENAQLNSAPDSLYNEPELAQIVLRVIATWSQIEVELTRLMSAFLKTDYLVVFSMLNAINTQPPRKRCRPRIIVSTKPS
jgi:hypothetical protein